MSPVGTRLALTSIGDGGEIDRFLAEASQPGRDVPNLQRALANNVQVARAMAAFGEVVRATDAVPASVIELAILRLALLAGAPYPFSHHVVIGRANGVTEDQLAALATWESADCFTDLDRTVLRAVDEIEGDAGLSQESYDALSGLLSDEHVVELVLLISFYGLVSRMANSLGVPVDERVRAAGEECWPTSPVVRKGPCGSDT